MTPFFLRVIARLMKVPDVATEMFSAANRMSGLDAQTLPTELIPLNATQLARGLLNFAVLQTIRGWVLPWWAEQQYNPHSSSFVPRSHMGLSINVTHRNWTGIGNPHCPVEPIVDPRGLVTPFRDGWSVDVWLVVDGRPFFPSRLEAVEQHLVHDLPIVRTSFEADGIGCTLTSYTRDQQMYHNAEVHNRAQLKKHCVLVFAIRPFNPEGISLVHRIRYFREEGKFQVNDDRFLSFEHMPDFAVLSTYEDGDSAFRLPHTDDRENVTSTFCEKGLANGMAGYHLVLEAGQSAERNCHVTLTGAQNGGGPTPAIKEAIDDWDLLLSRGASLTTPSEEINAITKASLSSLLMLTDGSDVTPGPLTYHQFWFRDAAYIISALDKFGFPDFTGPIIRTFPGRQERSGFFRSQKGEWDSNGQAVWTIRQHALRSRDRTVLADTFPSLLKGIEWIDEKRLKDSKDRGTPFFGLLSAGMSAEHLGLADYYFWDNAWSIAGIEAFIDICRELGRDREKGYAEQLATSYRTDMERAIQHVQQRHHIAAIPASPMRGIDCGMIGSCCFWYPLQILPPSDHRMAATLNIVQERFCTQGLFFQDFIHSGMNPYLTLHIAQALLYKGDRQGFWNLLMTVLSKASSTDTFPEAIHPITGGGSMGDGHHGWVCAEILHALRDAFVREYRNPGTGKYDVIMCSGIPGSWFNTSNAFCIHATRTLAGPLSFSVECEQHESRIRIDFEGDEEARDFVVVMPVQATAVFIDNQAGLRWEVKGEETHITLPPGSATVRVRHTGSHR